MQQITGSKKFPEGIQVSWSEQGNDLNDFFSYEELIAQKVNVLDVLNNPKNYQVNKAGHQIELFVRCGIPSCAYEDEIVISRLFDAPRDLPGGYGPSLILLCNGGGQKTTLHPSQKSISVWAENTSAACDRPKAATTGVPVCTGRLSDRSESSAPTAFLMKRAPWSRQRITA